MFSAQITQNDTFRINNFVISTFAKGDCGKLTFPNELINIAVDKQGNGILAINNDGLIADLEARLLQGNLDDQQLNSLLTQQMAGTPTLLTGVFTKVYADQQGNQSIVQITLAGGAFQHGIDALISSDGNIEQVVAVYKLRFANWQRQIL